MALIEAASLWASAPPVLPKGWRIDARRLVAVEGDTCESVCNRSVVAIVSPSGAMPGLCQERLELGNPTEQELAFVEEMGIKGRPADVRPVDDILHGYRLVPVLH